MFCKHEWKVLSETLTKSELDLCINAGVSSVKNASHNRTHIQIVTCTKCGKLKRFVEQIY